MSAKTDTQSLIQRSICLTLIVENIDIDETVFMQTLKALSITSIIYVCHIFSYRAPEKKISRHSDALNDLVPLAQFKNVKNTRRGVLLLVKLQATLLKLTLLHGCFSRFLHCTNGTKSRNALQLWPRIISIPSKSVVTKFAGNKPTPC